MRSATDAETMLPLRTLPGSLRSGWRLRLLQLLLHPLQPVGRDRRTEKEDRGERRVPAALRPAHRCPGNSHVLLER